MELTAGYKQTEIGVIPKDWGVVKLNEILIDFRNGFSFSAAKYVSSGIPIITMAQIGLNGNFQFDKAKINKWSEDELSILKDFWVKKGDLIIAMTDVTPTKNLIGQMAIVNIDQLFLLNQRVGLLKLNLNIASSIFYSYLSCTPLWKKYCKGVASLGVQANLSTKDIKNSFVVLPTKTEQTAIAKVLTDVDDLLESLDKLIAKKRDIKQATMQQLLTGKTRLPSFANNQGYKQTELGVIPEDWEVKELKDLGFFIKGKGIKKEETKTGNLPCIRYGEIYTHHENIIRKFYSKINNEIAKSSTMLKYGDLLFTVSGETKEEIGKCVAFIGNYISYAGSDIAILRSVQICPVFMGYFCNQYLVNSQRIEKSQGDAVVHINISQLKTIIVFSPPIKEQTAIGKILTKIDDEIEALEQRRNKLTNLKQGMMQQLLTGKIRLIKPKQHKE